MRLFERCENGSISSLLARAWSYRDRSPVAASLQSIVSDDVFGFLSRLDRRAEDDVFVFRQGVACARSVYFDQDRASFLWDRVQHMYVNEHATVYVRGLQRYFPEIKTILREIAPLYPGNMLFANLFCSPADSVGLKAHFDPTDFLVFQVHGSKLWRIWEGPPVEQGDAMMPEEVAEYSATIERSEPPSDEHLLHPGDVIYARRHTVHAPRTTHEHSTHITVGLAVPSPRLRPPLGAGRGAT